MKYSLIIVFIIFSFIHLNAQKTKNLKYKIIKIDLTENNYIIDIKDKDNHIFRIISEKNIEINKKCKPIVLNKKYKFKLRFVQPIFSGGKEVSIIVDDRVIYEDGDNFKVSFTDNLLGLCYKCNLKK